MNRYHIDLGNYGEKTNTGGLTFHGVVKQYYENICQNRGWNADSTVKDYKRDYVKVLLPHISDDKPLASFTPETCTEIMNSLLAERNLKSYRVAHFFRLIRAVLEKAVQLGILSEDIFAGTAYMPRLSGNLNTNGDVSLLKKSLNPAEDIAFLASILANPEPTAGVDMALLLIHQLGLRPGEAAGCNFEHFRVASASDKHFELRFIISTKAGTNIEQSGGKTPGASRRLVTDEVLYARIAQRENYVKEQLNTTSAVSNLPVACHDNSVQVRCSADDISARAKEHFLKLENSVETLGLLDMDLIVNDYKFDEIEEKDATTYALRRNFATKAHNWGVEEYLIQQMLGHILNSYYTKRHDFTNDDQLQVLRDAMEGFPLFELFRRVLNRSNEPIIHLAQFQLNEEHNYLEINNEESFELSIETGDEEMELYLHITANEPGDSISITFEDKPNNLVGRIDQQQVRNEYARSVNCHAIINRIYSEYLAKVDYDTLFTETQNDKQKNTGNE